MAKLVDAADSKSAASNGVLVRFQFWAQSQNITLFWLFYFIISVINIF
jgi:hypothetical protein